MNNEFKLTEQDKVNIEFAEKVLEKAKKKKSGWKKVKHLADWVGKVGFYECVAKLSKKKGIEDAKALCGALKAEARRRGTLKPEHMGRRERAEYLKRQRAKRAKAERK